MAELEEMEANAIEEEMADMAPASTYIAPVAQPAAAAE